MPTITFNIKDLEKQIGRKLSEKKLEELLEYCKAEIDDFNESTGEVKADFGDTNLPYLWSTEGIARLLKGIVEKEVGMPKLQIQKSKDKINVETTVNKVRPFIAAFVAKKCKIDDYGLKQIIQLQEKLCDTFGMKRKKVSVGIYSHKQIKFPITYKAVQPNKIKFVPLDFSQEMTLSEILEKHPKGKDYAYILEGQEKYPILIDADKNVLSFPPIINSSDLGKVTEDDTELLIEVTGEDELATDLTCNIFAQAFFDRGAVIEELTVKRGSKSTKTPNLFNESHKLDKESVEKTLGITLKETDIKKLLNMMRFEYKSGKVYVPPYRKDILHERDIIEDIAIAYGYNNFESEPLTTYTIGKTTDLQIFIDKLRNLMVGLGYQEVARTILSNKNLLYNLMETKDFGTIELTNAMSEQFNTVRSWILPQLMEILSKNRHVEYPQQIFEEGIVTNKVKGEPVDYYKLAAVSISEKSDYTTIKQAFEALLRLLGIESTIEESNHSSFIEGRVGKVMVNGEEVAVIGEVHPKVLTNFDLEFPAAAFELNISKLFEVTAK